MSAKKIAILVGSLRKASFNLKMAKALIAIAPESLFLEIVEIGNLQLYNQDLEENVPPEWTSFRKKMEEFDGLLFVTPEYNRSVPACLKNAIDVGSRPVGKSVWDKKPGAVISVSPSAIGAFGANHHLRQSLVSLNVPTMPQPEAYIGNAVKLFDENEKIINESTQAFLQKFMDAFAVWVDKNKL